MSGYDPVLGSPHTIPGGPSGKGVGSTGLGLYQGRFAPLGPGDAGPESDSEDDGWFSDDSRLGAKDPPWMMSFEEALAYGKGKASKGSSGSDIESEHGGFTSDDSSEESRAEAKLAKPRKGLAPTKSRAGINSGPALLVAQRAFHSVERQAVPSPPPWFCDLIGVPRFLLRKPVNRLNGDDRAKTLLVRMEWYLHYIFRQFPLKGGRSVALCPSFIWTVPRIKYRDELFSKLRGVASRFNRLRGDQMCPLAARRL